MVMIRKYKTDKQHPLCRDAACLLDFPLMLPLYPGLMVPKRLFSIQLFSFFRDSNPFCSYKL